MNSSAPITPPALPDAQGFSSTVRSVLSFTALAVTLLPIPVIYFKLVPVYQKHAWFLLFYTPFICLLTVCYLFYIRDSLARTTYANVLDPPPPPDPYYQEPLGGRLKRAFRKVKAVLLGLLPALLILTSMYCMSRYYVVHDESVAVAAEVYMQRSAASDSLQASNDQRESAGRRQRAKPTNPSGKAAAEDTARDSLPMPDDTTAVRAYLLRTSEIDQVPRLLELTALYVGAFVALLIAVMLMALKEYAKEALALSEHELMFGRYRRTVEEE